MTFNYRAFACLVLAGNNASAQSNNPEEPMGDCDLSLPHTPTPPPRDSNGKAVCYSLADVFPEFGPGSPDMTVPNSISGNWWGDGINIGRNMDEYLMSVRIEPGCSMGWEEPCGSTFFLYDGRTGSKATGESFFRRVDKCDTFPEHFRNGTYTEDLRGPDPVDAESCYIFRECYHDDTSSSHHSNEISLSPQRDGSLHWAYISCYANRSDNGPGRITAVSTMHRCAGGRGVNSCIDQCPSGPDLLRNECTAHCEENC